MLLVFAIDAMQGVKRQLSNTQVTGKSIYYQAIANWVQYSLRLTKTS